MMNKCKVLPSDELSMPTVNRYADDPGFYVTANPGAEHPINIKTRPEMDAIFEELDFGEKTEISHDLCWALYNTKLIYTKNSIDAPAAPTDDDLQFDTGAESLSPEQRDRLLDVIQDYNGSERVQELRDVLEDAPGFNTDSNTTSGGTEPDDRGEKLSEFLAQGTDDNESTENLLPDEVNAALDEWNPVLLRDTEDGIVEIGREDLAFNERPMVKQSIPRYPSNEFNPHYIELGDDHVEYGLHYEDHPELDRIEDIRVLDYDLDNHDRQSVFSRRYEATLHPPVVGTVTLTCVYDREDQQLVETKTEPPLMNLVEDIIWPDAASIKDIITNAQDEIQRLEMIVQKRE
jgi:hypothetical protein